MKKIKKILYFTLIMSILLMPATAFAQVTDINNKTISELQSEFGNSILITNTNTTTTDAYIGTPYEENSLDGYVQETGTDGKLYLYRIRHIKLTDIDYGPLTKISHICSVCAGYTYTVSQTYSDSKTVEQNWSNSTTVSVSASFEKLGAKIETAVENTYTFGGSRSNTVTYTTYKGETYSFPSNAPQGTNQADYYRGFMHDKYEIKTDIVKQATRLIEIPVVSTELLIPEGTVPIPGRIYKMIVNFADGSSRIIPSTDYNKYYPNDCKYKTETYWDYANKEVSTGEFFVPKVKTVVYFSTITIP